MRKHGGTPSRRDKHVTLAAISPPGVARGRFVGGQQSGLAGCKPPPLFTRGASSCSSQGRRQGEPWGASPRPSAPTYLPLIQLRCTLKHWKSIFSYFPSFGRNPRASLDFLAYSVPEACMHVLGNGVPRRLGVARSASNPKAAQALGCSLTPGLWISFGRVTCMARAASVPGLWTLGSLLLCGVCAWVRAVLGFGFR